MINAQSIITLIPAHNHATRYVAKFNYCLPMKRTELGNFFLLFLGPNIWASIPIEIKLNLITMFESKLKKHYVEKYVLG